MKKQGRIFLIAVLSVALLSGCTKNNGLLNNASLKKAVIQSASDLNIVMDKISATQAYSILTVNDETLKSESVTDSIYRVYIPLDLIKGVYEYKPVPKSDRWGFSLIQYFEKTADNSVAIVRMPLKKVKNPRSLRHYSLSDSSLTNNFSIAVSEYHNNYNSYWDYDYILASEISVDNLVAGKLNIKSNVSHEKGIHYASQYEFTDSYKAKYKYESGDTTVSSFTILSGDKIAYEEKLLKIKNDSDRHHGEHQYILTMGNVQIIRASGSEKVQIAVDGIVQPNAVVEIVDDEYDEEASVCKKRDIQITFEDGTITTISALIGNSVENIKTLYSSLHKVYFAAYIVDWIAYDIYYHRN